MPLLGPAAERLGIDLIWFGVILGVNMQTSFMHPPFGFSLFYLRSVAPKNAYLDKITGKRMEPVTTGQIYWGAVPFVCIQVIMIGLVIMFPQMVMHYKGVGTGVDPNSIQNLDLPRMEACRRSTSAGGGLPGLEAPGGDRRPCRGWSRRRTAAAGLQTRHRRCPVWSRPRSLARRRRLSGLRPTGGTILPGPKRSCRWRSPRAGGLGSG